MKVCNSLSAHCIPTSDLHLVEEPDEDNMEEIDTANVVGSRTRGKNIDFAKANQELGEDEDEDDDEDFVDPDDEMKD